MSITSFGSKFLQQLGDSLGQAARAPHAEDALLCLNRLLAENLGDRQAHTVPGALKEGEKQQFACGAFFLTPDGTENILIAPVNYQPEQVHMRIATDLGHPGWVIANKSSLLLRNTDDESGFVKILRTFRAGSVVYAPLLWQGRMLGQIICAAQARNTMSEADLQTLEVVAGVAALTWIAHGGDAYLEQLVR